MVELMISMVLLAFIFGQVFEAFGMGNRIWDANSNQLIRQKEARNIASFLARDIRLLENYPATTSLDSSGDSVTLETVDGDVEYQLTIDGTEGSLSRAGNVIGSHVQSLNLTSSSSVVEIDIITYTSSILGGTANYQLKTKVRRRND